MAVRQDIYEPDPHKVDDPTMSQKEAQDKEAKYWEEKAKSARAKREYEEEESRSRKLSGETDSPFQIKGSVNLGSFDFQKQQEELKAEMERVKNDSETQMAALQKSNDDYRERVHEIQMKQLESMWALRFDALQKMLADTQANRSRSEDKSISQQIKEIEEISGLLGYKRLDSAALTTNSPIELQIAILKMNAENARAEREFQLKLKQDDRDWQMQLKRLEFDGAAKKAELEQAKEKQGMLAALPETIGRAIGRGIADKGTGQIISGQPQAPRQPQSYHLEASIGESGETDCPKCHSQIYIAKDSAEASCTKCGLKVPIMRSGAQPQYEDTEV